MAKRERQKQPNEFGGEPLEYCDSCVHEAWEHSKETGACQRINPVFGPCPCDHTSQEEWAVQRAVFLASKGQRDREGRTNN